VETFRAIYFTGGPQRGRPAADCREPRTSPLAAAWPVRRSARPMERLLRDAWCAHEKTWHGMFPLAIPLTAEDAVQETFPESCRRSIARLSRPIEFRHLDNTGSLIKPRATNARRSRLPQERSRKTTIPRKRRVLSPAPRPGAHPSLRMALERAPSAKASRKHQRDVFFPPCTKSKVFRHAEIAGDAGDDRDCFEEHTFSGEEKSSPDGFEPPRSSGAEGTGEKS